MHLNKFINTKLKMFREQTEKSRNSINFYSQINPNPLGCVQNRIQIGGFGTVRVNQDVDPTSQMGYA